MILLTGFLTRLKNNTGDIMDFEREALKEKEKQQNYNEEFEAEKARFKSRGLDICDEKRFKTWISIRERWLKYMIIFCLLALTGFFIIGMAFGKELAIV